MAHSDYRHQETAFELLLNTSGLVPVLTLGGHMGDIALLHTLKPIDKGRESENKLLFALTCTVYEIKATSGLVPDFATRWPDGLNCTITHLKAFRQGWRVRK